MQKILVTGVAGFIGYHLAKALCEQKYEVIGIDNLNDYYDVNLKKARLDKLKINKNFLFKKIDLCEREKFFNLFNNEKFNYVINLAAQAGVRYSIENPYAYIDSNIVGFMNILEACRNYPIKHLIYASSSSVYGSNMKQPFSETDNVDHPLSLYAATKKSNELMAHTYSSLYNIPTSGLRFFTVYGTYGRPDMAYFSFTKNILEGKPIRIFNNGNLERDFTHISDIVDGIIKLLEIIPQSDLNWDKVNPNPATSFAPYRIYNIGNNQPIKLMKFISILEEKIGKEAVKQFVPMQAGDVYSTYANINLLNRITGFKPQTLIEEGIEDFVNWYKYFYNK